MINKSKSTNSRNQGGGVPAWHRVWAANPVGGISARPVLSAEDACTAVRGPPSSVYAAIDRLRDAGVPRPLIDRKRDQVWGASLVLDEFGDLGSRIGRAAASYGATQSTIRAEDSL